MVTVTIAAILMSIGIPSYRYVTYSNRVSTEVNSLLGDMQYARSEAVKEGATVTICPSNPAQTQCVNSSAWQAGWIIFSDVNNNAMVTARDNILRVTAPFASTPQDSFVSDNGLIYVSFNREGFATSFPATPSGYVTFTLHTTPGNPLWTRCLQVFSTGMMATERTSDRQGNCT
jgi:type IV fimbrial biogenesis protein FimT